MRKEVPATGVAETKTKKLTTSNFMDSKFEWDPRRLCTWIILPWL